jgi:calcyclin binding protein
LTSKKGKNPPGQKDDPQNSIMQMMKDMYDDGDDNMKKIIGEAFSKQQRGEMASGVGGMGDSGDGLGDI